MNDFVSSFNLIHVPSVVVYVSLELFDERFLCVLLVADCDLIYHGISIFKYLLMDFLCPS